MKKMEKAVSIALTLTLLLSMMMALTPKVSAQTTTVEFSPSITSITTLNQEFTVSCRVNDVTDLAGFDIQIKWDLTYLQYVAHSATLKCLKTPTFMTKDVVDESDPDRYYWCAAATLSGTGFTGSDEAFWMTFRAINVPYGTPGNYLDTLIHFTTSVDLADTASQPIDHTTTDGIARIYYREFTYPPIPLLKLDPAIIKPDKLGDTFDENVWLMGLGETDLDAFWDVAGIDAVMHYNTTQLDALSVTIDPDGTFAGFWPGGLYLLIDPPEINDAAGTVHVAFIGIPHAGGAHTAPHGKIRMFSVNFQATIEVTSLPQPTSKIYLKNPTAYTGQYVFDSIGGLIDPTDPVGTHWHELVPNFCYGPLDLTSWEDNGDLELSTGDQFVLTDPATDFYFDYHVDYVTGTLNLTQQPFPAEDGMFVMDAPTQAYSPWPKTAPGTDDQVWNGHGHDNWFGTFSLTYPASSIANIHVTPQIGAEYDLVPGVDYVLNPDGTVTLLHPLDEFVWNEDIGAVPFGANAGWPPLTYIASGIQSVYISAPGSVVSPGPRYAVGVGYALPPPNEYWFDPDFPYELESWWATGYYPDPSNWLPGTEVFVNYTAPVWIDVTYFAIPDPNPRYLEFSGSYADFLAALNSPIGTNWDEVYPYSWRDYSCIDWNDAVPGGMVTPGDYLTFDEAVGEREYYVNAISTDIGASRKPWICEENPTDPFFGMAPIIGLPGFPHPDNWYCPWHSHDYSVNLPHAVTEATYTVPYRSLGGEIDVYTQYPFPFGGQGRNNPSDMFYPQKEVLLCANVTYAGWPEQNKDVAFEIKFPNGTVYVVMYNRTNAWGMACVHVRLPWPCDDPESIFGVWKVWATVDVACKIVNDTLQFKYDYRVRIFDVTIDDPLYSPNGFKHCENIVIHVTYASQFIQKHIVYRNCDGTILYEFDNNVTITMTVTDASGVPFGFDYVEVQLGTDNMQDWCQYYGGIVDLQIHVVKWARPGAGTLYVGALSDFPQNGGTAETPVYVVYPISILAEWAPGYGP